MLTRRTQIQSMGAALLASRLSAFVPDPDFGTWSDGEKEKFLLSAKIVSAEDIGHGVTHPVKVKMELAGVQHSAAIQRVEKELSDFFAEDKTRVPMRDSWHFNVAAYKVDRLIGLNMVTVEVPRPYQNKPGSFSWWVDNVMFEEVDRIKKDLIAPNPQAFDNQRALTRVFDELIINIDRNNGNLLITKDWKIALIDHSRSFTAYPGIRNKENLTRCSRKMLDGMKSLTAASLAKATGPHLTAAERSALLGRRDRIAEFFENLVKQKGEENVLFS